MNIIHDTPELRARLDAHNQEAIALHIPTAPVTWLDLKVEAIDGTVIHEHREKANSWVRNFYNALATCFLPSTSTSTYGAGDLGSKKTSGSTGSASAPTSFIPSSVSYTAGVLGNTGYGILVGTGTAAESFEDYKIETLIENGSGAGQLMYQEGVFGAATYDSETKKWTQAVERVFNNNSAGAITITEIGWGVYASSSNYLRDRSLLVTPVEVPAANKLTVTYTTEMTFPA